MNEPKEGVVVSEPKKPTMLQLQELTVEAAKHQMKLYQEYVSGLLDNDTDYQMIQGKHFKKKSAWRKLAMAMNLSVRVVSERREELPGNDFAYHFVCEATHPNGRVTGGSGSCTALEKSKTPNSLHNVRSTAETRAFNRAVSNMIAAGEVSAEEVDQGNTTYQYQPTEGMKEGDVVTAATANNVEQMGKVLGGHCQNCEDGIYKMSKAGNLYCSNKCWL